MNNGTSGAIEFYEDRTKEILDQYFLIYVDVKHFKVLSFLIVVCTINYTSIYHDCHNVDLILVHYRLQHS